MGHRAASLFVLCVVTAAIGCGGDGRGSSPPLSKVDYEQQMQSLGNDFVSTLDGLGEASDDDGSDIEAIRVELTAVATLLDDQSQSLERIVPPADVADAHEAMVERLAAVAGKLREAADDLESASIADLIGLFESEEFVELDAAVREIQDRGYDIGEGW